FGSGLAIVPFLREGVVVQHHWLTSSQFIDAVAMGLITPGPVVITATFIGYLVAGLPGALVSTVAIFTPIYLGVRCPRPLVRPRPPPPADQGLRQGAPATRCRRDRRAGGGAHPPDRHRPADERHRRCYFRLAAVAEDPRTGLRRPRRPRRHLAALI